MSTNEKFSNDKKFGKAGEEDAMVYCFDSPNVLDIMDVSKDDYFREKDIDLLLLMKDGTIIKVEVKTDSQAHQTGNMAFETMTNGNIGCLAKSEADWIYYYLEKNGKVYLVDLPKLKEYIRITNPEEKRMGDNARGYLLNLEELRRKRIAKRSK